MSTTSWIERDERVVWHGFTQMSCYGSSTPVIVQRGGTGGYGDAHFPEYTAVPPGRYSIYMKLSETQLQIGPVPDFIRSGMRNRFEGRA